MSATAQDRFREIEQQPLVQVGGARFGPRSTLRKFAEIAANRQMLDLLIRRDLKSRYKDSFLGFLWTLVRPITQLLIYYIALGKFLGAERGIADFAIYVFCGLTAYGFFSEIVSSGTGSVVGNAGLVKKIYLPREVFPIASVGAALFNFAIQMVVLLVATLVLGRFPISPDIVYAIPSFLVLMIFGAAVAFLLAGANVYLRDIQYLVEVVLLVLLWASPIVYPWQTVRDVLTKHPVILQLYTDNPITLAVLGFQRAFWISGHGTVDYPVNLMSSLWIAVAVGIVATLAAQQVFARLAGNFAQAL